MNGKRYSIVQNTMTSKRSLTGRHLTEFLMVLSVGILFLFAAPSLFVMIKASTSKLFSNREEIKQQVLEELSKGNEAALNSIEGFDAAVKLDLEQRFYTELTGDYTIVENVYTYANTLDKDFLFAMIWHESGFKPNCKNNNWREGIIVSIDRGLFQLNSKSYPDIAESSFYHIPTNIKLGVGHIREALSNQKGNITRALYEYNAGRTRVNNPPESTIRYASLILEKSAEIKRQRLSYIVQNFKFFEESTSVIASN